MAEGTNQRVGLYGIAQFGARAVGLDIADVFRIDAEALVDTEVISSSWAASAGSGNAIAGAVLVHARAWITP